MKNRSGLIIGISLMILPILILVSSLHILVGCEHDESLGHSTRPVEYKVIVVDSCEYMLVWDRYPNMAAIHKGNCNNPVHKKEE